MPTAVYTKRWVESKLVRFRARDVSDTLIRIDVGTGSAMRTFSVLGGYLCFYSGYFSAALNGRYIESQDSQVKLSTEDPQIFELFRNWIHTRQFYQSTLAPSQLLPFKMIAKLWVFADAHVVPLLQNVASDIMVEKIKDTRTFPSLDDLTYIYGNTIDTSRLRLLIGEIFCVLCGEELAWDEFAAHSDEREHQRSDYLQPRMKYSNLRLSEWHCKHHVHEEGVSCKNL